MQTKNISIDFSLLRLKYALHFQFFTYLKCLFVIDFDCSVICSNRYKICKRIVAETQIFCFFIFISYLFEEKECWIPWKINHNCQNLKFWFYLKSLLYLSYTKSIIIIPYPKISRHVCCCNKMVRWMTSATIWTRLATNSRNWHSKKRIKINDHWYKHRITNYNRLLFKTIKSLYYLSCSISGVWRKVMWLPFAALNKRICPFMRPPAEIRKKKTKKL